MERSGNVSTLLPVKDVPSSDAGLPEGENTKEFVDPEPHRIRIMSWNIDGLDQNNIQTRAKAVCREIAKYVFLNRCCTFMIKIKLMYKFCSEVFAHFCSQINLSCVFEHLFCWSSLHWMIFHYSNEFLIFSNLSRFFVANVGHFLSFFFDLALSDFRKTEYHCCT